MTTTRRATNPTELLRLIPPMLGCHPTQSLVLLPLVDGCSVGVIRVDLPTEEHLITAFANTTLGIACRVDGIDAAVAIAYSAAPLEAGLPRRVMSSLLAHADACGLHVSDALIVASDGWGRVDADGEVSSRGSLAHIRPPGATLPIGQSSTAALPDVPNARVSRIRERIRRLDSGPTLADELVPMFEDALTDDSDDTLARLSVCLERPALRDIALLQWTTGRGAEAHLSQLAWQDGSEYPRALAEAIWGEGPRPRRSRLERALERAKIAAAIAPEDSGAGALAVCAWLSWALGRSTHAERFATMATDRDPEHGLAHIVLRFVQAGHLPAWAFRGSDAA